MYKHTTDALVRRTGMGPSARPLALALALTAVALGHAALASADWTYANSDRVVDGRLVDVQIQVGGQAVPLYPSPRGDQRTYFEAQRGRNYEVALHNNTGQRVGVLIAVDGLNVITGDRSRLSRSESMYVLDPWEQTVIRGWRSSLHDVRRFVFVDEERSYAERTGQANGDLGWIRVLTFREDRPLAWLGYKDRDRRDLPQAGAAPREQESREGAANEAPAPSLDKSKAERKGADLNGMRSEMAPESNPGTGWGDRQVDPVRQVDFRAARQATDQLVMRYEYAAGLQALGIRPWRSNRNRTHDRDRGELGFAQPPKW
ncbi:MAG: hypothetical protein HOP12_16250 [Candidatus Eisenbacteria bacterium]|uniref:Uncharacterized protein n=1 Tax=Eiseniibacteriota bacterium TaxID=2212470 RepID=A0A849SPJ0_UNCEI|nr:hypothetical protein [Candidatus Eisenbacteria bacterium]